jgi:Zn-dependent protease
VDINIGQILISFLVLVFSLTVHESAHAWAADRLGDPTARSLGRVSLNPLVHIDPIGTVLFPLVGMLTSAPIFGWAKPVPVATWRFENPRRDYLMVAAAGPVSNLALAFVGAIAWRLSNALIDPHAGATLTGIGAPIATIAFYVLATNLLLALFNLLPVPPLDGSTVLAGLLPERMAAGMDRIRPYGFVLLYALLLSGAFRVVVLGPYNHLMRWLL